ncbi:substrate-binding domain-containing protein [Methanolobus sp. WCC1]|uniref:substrate-binding domain-containing protein n=1 Tax=unclassified Methanolobus TaxID=2629569 RepID=UPI0032556D8E
MFKKIFNDEAGVSPIVATLVLVVVAIAGAAAVGTIMGSFSSDVSDSASAGDAMAASSTTLRLAGSTTVTPVAELIAEAYMEDRDINVDVQEGGSDAGISGALNDLIDIGMASKDVTKADYPDIETHTIGYSAVVVIANNANINESNNVTLTDLRFMYENASAGKITLATPSAGSQLAIAGSGTEFTLFQRSDASGTEETFAKALGGEYYNDKDVDDSSAIGASGNQGVYDKVAGTANSIGFVDYGFAKGSTEVTIIAIDNFGPVTESDIKGVLRGDDTLYEEDLTRPLNFLTNGEPSSLESDFIDFAMSPGSIPYFTECGYYARTQIDY